MQKSRMGRPIEGSEPRNKQITFRVTEAFLQKLAKCSEITGRTRTDLFESAICDLYDRLTENDGVKPLPKGMGRKAAHYKKAEKIRKPY